MKKKQINNLLKKRVSIKRRTATKFSIPKIILITLTMVASVAIIFATAYQVKLSHDTRSDAASLPRLAPPNNDYFRTPYETIARNFSNQWNNLKNKTTYNPVLQVFNGALITREFLENSHPNIYAGHLGGFVAPPFASDSETGDSAKAFHTGLVLIDRNTKERYYENYADHKQTQAYWSPAKMEVINYLPVDGGTVKTRGVKMALPNVRGFGLRLELTNNTSSNKDYSLMLVAHIPQFTVDNTDWNWEYHSNGNTQVSVEYDSSENVYIASTPEHAYLLLGISQLNGQPPSPHSNYTWRSNNMNAVSDTINLFTSTTGVLDGAALPPTAGSTVNSANFSLILGNARPQDTKTVTFLGFVGDSKQEVVNLWKKYKSVPNLETLVTQSWDKKLTQLFSNHLPTVSFPNKDLEKIYYSSGLQYLLHRWTTPEILSEQNYRGHSVAFFPWTTGTEQVLTQADPTFWRKMILKMATINYGKCRTYSPLGNLCDTHYSQSILGLIKIVTEYVYITGDKSILSEPIGSKDLLTQLATLQNKIDSKADNSGLVDFGDDTELYELSYMGCTLGGNYTGKVPSTNAEKYLTQLYLSHLFSARNTGNDASQATYFLKKAAITKKAVNTLWNNQTQWFNTISLYQSRKRPSETKFARQQPLVLTSFYFQPILNMLGYPNFLTADQTSALNNRVSDFIGSQGFLTFPTDQLQPQCKRTDWQGPGLYSGSIGLMLSDLFQNGQPQLAYSVMTNKYKYLVDTPIWAQQYRGVNGTPMEDYRSWYVESVSLAQAYIKGMMGLQPIVSGTAQETNLTWLKPQIPDEAIANQTVSFSNAWSQGHLFSLDAYKDHYVVTMKPTVTTHTRFGWGGNRKATVKITMSPRTKYNITIKPTNINVKATTFIKNADHQGILSFDIPKDESIIIVTSSPN